MHPLLLFEFPSLKTSTGLTILNYMTFLSTMLLLWLRSVWQVWLWVCVIPILQFIRHLLVLWMSKRQISISNPFIFKHISNLIIFCMYMYMRVILLICIRTLNNLMTLVLVWSWLVPKWCRWLTIVYHMFVAKVSCHDLYWNVPSVFRSRYSNRAVRYSYRTASLVLGIFDQFDSRYLFRCAILALSCRILCPHNPLVCIWFVHFAI